MTASDFTAQDALTSQPVRLVVRGKCVGLVPSMALANLPTLRMINFSAAGTAATGSVSCDLLEPTGSSTKPVTPSANTAVAVAVAVAVADVVCTVKFN